MSREKFKKDKIYISTDILSDFKNYGEIEIPDDSIDNGAQILRMISDKLGNNAHVFERVTIAVSGWKYLGVRRIPME